MQNVYWQGVVGPREFAFESDAAPHLHARAKVAELPGYLKERLKASIYLDTLLYTPVDLNEIVDAQLSMKQVDMTGKLMTLRPDWATKTAIAGIGLSDVSLTLGDLLRILENPQRYNIPLSMGEAQKIKAKLTVLGGSDPIMRSTLQDLR